MATTPTAWQPLGAVSYRDYLRGFPSLCLVNVIWIFSDQLELGRLRGYIGVAQRLWLARQYSYGQHPPRVTMSLSDVLVPGGVPPTARNFHGVDYPTKERRRSARLTQLIELLIQIPAVEPSNLGLMISGSFPPANGRIPWACPPLPLGRGEATKSLSPTVVRSPAPDSAVRKC